MMIMMTGRTENQWKTREQKDCTIFKIGKNTPKSPGEPCRLIVTQTPVKEYHLKSARKKSGKE